MRWAEILADSEQNPVSNDRQIILKKPTKTHQTEKRRTEKLAKTVTCLRKGAKPSANSA